MKSSLRRRHLVWGRHIVTIRNTSHIAAASMSSLAKQINRRFARQINHIRDTFMKTMTLEQQFEFVRREAHDNIDLHVARIEAHNERRWQERCERFNLPARSDEFYRQMHFSAQTNRGTIRGFKAALLTVPGVRSVEVTPAGLLVHISEYHNSVRIYRLEIRRDINAVVHQYLPSMPSVRSLSIYISTQ